MPRPKTQSESAQIICRIIALVKEHGRITTKKVVAMFDLHRPTSEKYIRIAVLRGDLIRYGRCGIFRDQHVIIDFDFKRFSYSMVTEESYS
ncbi:DUF977 family protein [Enterobacter ludwigii]|uniref:DUF977 family protein n=1 Tax=Enterobacter ludwigii TaxID=299767 RepID=UPI0006437E12|nr:DUF977 family protein [Enterobacter ludwigii]KLP33452.1 hypothetical protein ABR36_23385 [Enterobacter ludwigii]